MPNQLMLQTPACLICNNASKDNKIWVPDTQEMHDAIRFYQYGAKVQQAFPMLTDGQREQIISGTHSECFDAAFPADA